MSGSLDPLFAVYGVRFHFTLEGVESDTSTMKPWIYRTDPGLDAVRAEAAAVWPTIDFTRGGVEPDWRMRVLTSITVVRRVEAPWAVWWFSHLTFRLGRTDGELRASFERFVARHEPYQDRLSRLTSAEEIEYARGERVCLMGAQERWRWKTICTCETCVANGWAIIAH